MGTVRKTITLTDLHDRWIKAQIAAGHFTNDSEYIRDLIRRDRERGSERERRNAVVQEGLDGGPSDKTVPSSMEDVEARFEVKPHAFGFKPGVDVDRLNQLVDELETAELAEKLRR